MNSIAAYLERNKVSQQEFADQIGVSQPTVHAWASGSKKPEGDNIHRVAQALGIPATDVLIEFHLGESP